MRTRLTAGTVLRWRNLADMDLSAYDNLARDAASRAYAPYSGYQVGAVVLDELGRAWTGCNVENVSYGLTLCAERNATASMVQGGGKRITGVVVYTRDLGTPCGPCRQVLVEFAAVDTPVRCIAATGEVQEFTVGDLLPYAFSSPNVGRNPQ